MHRKSSRNWTTTLLIVTAAFVLGYYWQTGPGALAAKPNGANLKQVKDFQLPTEAAGPPGRKAFTIYMGRKAEKVKAAQRMNALHDAMAAKGYTLQHVAAHWENSDLEGWWITYLAENGG